MSAADLPEKTEISFKIGDSTLNINGKQVTVEAPFVAGVGVTMVPARVITEAFGADVGWNGDTQTVTINYNEISISMVIGSKTAVVNGGDKKMLNAPVVLGVGTTMIPLRFISETFGAYVDWDGYTQAVTVMKIKATMIDFTNELGYYHTIESQDTGIELTDEQIDTLQVQSPLFVMSRTHPNGTTLTFIPAYLYHGDICIARFGRDDYTVFYAVFMKGTVMYEHFVTVKGIYSGDKLTETTEETGKLLDSFDTAYDVENWIQEH